MTKHFFFLLLFAFSSCHSSIYSPEGEETDATFSSYFRWVNYLQENDPSSSIIVAAFGKPAAPLNENILIGFRQFWGNLSDTSSLPYTETAGGGNYRKQMAAALEKEYSHKIAINPDDVIFTVGGCGALQATFYAIHHMSPKGKIVVITPYYPQYKVLYGGACQNNLHPIDVTKTGFRLTAKALEDSLAKIDSSEISAFVFCDPNNPCGTTPGEHEWLKIAEILRKGPKVPIILDEAYAEMCFHENHKSLLEVCPELIDRIVLIRSATKSLSAAGERLAVALVGDKKVRSLMLDYLTNVCLHSPVSHHYAYAYAMSNLTQEHKNQIATFYEKRLRYMEEAVHKLGINLKDESYKPTATFYMLADFTVLKGQALHPKAAYILKKTEDAPKIETDLDVAFHLLFDKQVAITPLSFFGLDASACLMRITCADELEVLDEMVGRIKFAL